MAHAHHHHHHHDHGPVDFSAAFGIGIALNMAYVLAEAGYGFSAGSLALVADAGHNLSDVFGLALAWGAAALTARPATATHSYGFRKTSILAALANALLLLAALGAIAWNALERLQRPEPVASGTVMIVAGIGIAINATTAMLFTRGRHGDINIRGAFLHMAADAVVSVGVVVSGFLILRTGLLWIDPVTSLIIVLLIALSTWDLLRRSVDMALDAVPEGIDLAVVRSYLESIDGVVSVHDLHIWGMSTTEAALTAHLVAPDGLDDEDIRTIGRELHDQFGIEHPTIQVEREIEGACPLRP